MIAIPGHGESSCPLWPESSPVCTNVEVGPGTAELCSAGVAEAFGAALVGVDGPA